MHITVAICTWNRCALLRETLAQLTRVAAPEGATWSLLVVNNNSTDATESVLDEFASILPLRRVFEPTPGLSHARNRALREAEGDYILWTDDDVLVDEQWIAEFANVARRYPEAAAMGGPVEPWFPVAPDATLLDVYHWLQTGFCGLDYGLPEGPVHLHLTGANFALRLSVVVGKSFDPGLGTSPDGGGGEDAAFIRMLHQEGRQVIWCPALKVKHYVDPSRMTKEYLERYAYHFGRQTALLLGVGLDAPTIFAVPRWFWREWLVATVANLVSMAGVFAPALPHRLRSGRLPSRSSMTTRRLAWRRERLYLNGMIKGYRERARRAHVIRAGGDPLALQSSEHA